MAFHLEHEGSDLPRRGVSAPAAEGSRLSAELWARQSGPAPNGSSLESGGSTRQRLTGRRKWKVLAIEDDADDVLLVRSALRDARGALTGDFGLVSCESIAAGLEYLRSAPVDVVLLDLALPDSVGVEGLEQIRAAWPALPIVVLTGQEDELLALRALQEGAEDYIPKSQMVSTLLTRSLRHAIERKHAELTTIASEARYRQLLEAAGEGVWTFDLDGIVDYANPRMLEMLGLAAPELIGGRVEELVVPLQRSALSEILARCTDGERIAREFTFLRSDGSELCAKMSCNPLRSRSDEIVGTLAFFTDLTERYEAERVLRERKEKGKRSRSWRRRSWKRWDDWPAASRTTSTTC